MVNFYFAPHTHTPSLYGIHQEAMLLAQQAIPGLDGGLFKDLHLDFLRQKSEVLASGEKGSKLANRINDLSVQFQKALAQTLGDEAYMKLTGSEPGETITYHGKMETWQLRA
jgi:hypothetical protein